VCDLGNGRPFVIRIVEPQIESTTDILQSIVASISSGSGLNKEKDVDVKTLIEVYTV
jgi:hypothetical protein